jgi:hypothetical protein
MQPGKLSSSPGYSASPPKGFNDPGYRRGLDGSFQTSQRNPEISVRTLFRHNLRLPHEVIAIINRMFPARAAAGICGCAGANRFVEQTQKKGVSELSANRGCLLTNWASARNPFGGAPG